MQYRIGLLINQNNYIIYGNEPRPIKAEDISVEHFFQYTRDRGIKVN